MSGAVAQLGERIVRNDEVAGSIPASSTNRLPRSFDCAQDFGSRFPFVFREDSLTPAERLKFDPGQIHQIFSSAGRVFI